MKNAKDECQTGRNCGLILGTERVRIVNSQNLPLVLEAHSFILKAIKIFISVETMESFEQNVLQITRDADVKCKVGSFYLHRFIAGVLAEMTKYEEAINSIESAINCREKVLNLSSVSEVHSLNPVSKDDHREAFSRSYSYLAVLQFRVKDYKASLKSQRRSLDITLDMLGERHSDTADRYRELAFIMRA